MPWLRRFGVEMQYLPRHGAGVGGKEMADHHSCAHLGWQLARGGSTGTSGRQVRPCRRYPRASSMVRYGGVEMDRREIGRSHTPYWKEDEARRNPPHPHAGWSMGLVDHSRGNISRSGVQMGAVAMGWHGVGCVDRGRKRLVVIQPQGSTRPSKAVKSRP